MLDLFSSLSSCALFAHDAQRHTLDCSDEVSLTWQQHLEHCIGSRHGACAG